MLNAIQKPGLFITGTDTGVGKTFIASAIANWFWRKGVSVGACKIAATGCELQGNQLIADDARILSQAIGGRFSPDEICPLRYAEPLAPAVAAQRSNHPIHWESLQSTLHSTTSASDVMIIEGVGGLMVPMDDQHTVLDVANWLQLPAVVVARPSLGTINHTLLTVNALRAIGLQIAGVVINRFLSNTNDVAQATNAQAIKKWGKVPVLCVVPEGDASAIETVNWAQAANTTRVKINL